MRPGESKGGKIGVAVSGGADSVALLLLLSEVRAQVREQYPFEIAVAHFNHQLRGRAADADEKFVRALAETHALPFYLGSADVGVAAKRAKRNVEDAGRRERYAYFAKLVSAGEVGCVATAHTMDDQAETVLAHILRGTGLAGLAGIHARSGSVVRPLLGIRRAELRTYLKARKQSWREDATNRDTTKTRARIREKLIPLLQKQFQPEAVEHLAKLAEHAWADEEFLDGAMEEKLRTAIKDGGADAEARGEVRIRVEDLVGGRVAEALRGRMVRKLVKMCKGRAGELGAQHVASVLQLAEDGENGKSLQLPGGVEVRRERETLEFLRMAGVRGASASAVAYEFPIELPIGLPLKIPLGLPIGLPLELAERGRTVEIPLLRRAIRLTMIDWFDERGETSGVRAVVDYARLTGRLVLRNWRPGDRMRPAGAAGFIS